MGITRKRRRGKVSQSDSKRGRYRSKQLPSDLGVRSYFRRAWLRLRAQNDADTKVTSLVDYLFFAPIGL